MASQRGSEVVQALECLHDLALCCQFVKIIV